jgi:hypothetical protein
MAARCEPLERTEIRHDRPSVHEELALALFSHRQHQLVPFDIGRKVGDLNGHRADGPGVAVAPDSGCAIRRRKLGSDRFLGALHDVGSVASLGEEAAGLEDHERELPASRFADGRDDRIPLTRRRQAGNAALDPAEGPWVADLVLTQATWGSMSP